VTYSPDGAVRVEVPGIADLPGVSLLDGRPDRLDEAALRRWAREWAPARSADHVSRSYRFPYALVAWHTAAVGVDIERLDSTLGADFANVICTPQERATLATEGADHRLLSSLWSSKEALSKALGDALEYDPSRLESPMTWPQLRSGRWRAAELGAPSGHVAWLCWCSES